MVLEKIGTNLGKDITAWTRTSGKNLLTSKPIKVNLNGLKYAPQLEHDVVEIGSKKVSHINKKAQEAFQKLQEEFPNIERLFGTHCADEQIYKFYKSMYEANPDLFVLFRSKFRTNSYPVYNKRKAILELAKETPSKEIENGFSELNNYFYHKVSPEKNIELINGKYKLTGTTPRTPEDFDYINMMFIKRYNPKTYKYLMEHQNPNRTYRLLQEWGDPGSIPTTTFLKEITPSQLEIMDVPIVNVKGLGSYVANSDVFVQNPKAVEELSKGLSKYKIPKDVELYRSEKGVGIFASVPIDKNLEKQVRKLLTANKENAQMMKVSDYTGRYLTGPNKNLYDFIMQKENLTLADAMQVARYGDEKYIETIAKLIQNTKLTDTRFKSLSLDKGMAMGWGYHNAGDNPVILHKAKVKQGTQGGYIPDNNGQFEVLLNNTPKEMKFNNIIYNKNDNLFTLETEIKNI